jgi:hypothetical protein
MRDAESHNDAQKFLAPLLKFTTFSKRPDEIFDRHAPTPNYGTRMLSWARLKA